MFDRKQFLISEILDACENVKKKEDGYAEKYIHWNPQDKARRLRDSAIYKQAVEDVWREILPILRKM